MNLSLFSLLTSPQAQTAAGINMMSKLLSNNLTNNITPTLLPFFSGAIHDPKTKSLLHPQPQISVSMNMKKEHPQDGKESQIKVKAESESVERSLADNLMGKMPTANLVGNMPKLVNLFPLVQKSNLIPLYSGLAASKIQPLKLDNPILGNIVPSLSEISANQHLLAQLLQNNLRSVPSLQGTNKNEMLENGLITNSELAAKDLTTSEPVPNKKVHKTEGPKLSLTKKVKTTGEETKNTVNEEEKRELVKVSKKEEEENSDDSIAYDSVEEEEEEEEDEEDDAKEELFKPTKHCYYVTKKTIKDKKILPKRTSNKNSQRDIIDPAQLISSLHEGAEQILGYKDFDHARLYSVLVKSEMQLDITLKKLRSNLNYYKRILKLKKNESS